MHRDATNRPRSGFFGILASAGVLSLLLAVLPGRSSIPPLIESDYCYLLTASDRILAGHGLTATPPVAPFQEWEWVADWSYLTKWPAGYPLLVAGVRWVTGASTLQACSWINVLLTSLALVGWFVWVRRCVPPGICGYLLAAVAAGCAVSTAMLLNPSTDLIIVAAIPYLLLFVMEVLEANNDGASRNATRFWIRFLWLGVLAGSLFWFRYASLFVPVCILVFLVIHSRFSRRHVLQQVLPFALGSGLVVGALLVLNSALVASHSLQEQLNLGTTVSIDFSWTLLWTTWWRFTDLGFYDYHAISHWVFAIWPILFALFCIIYTPARSSIAKLLRTPAMGLSVAMLIGLLAMLISATAFFSGKYNYVGLDRYYLPVRPLYFVLFVGPLFAWRFRFNKAVMGLLLWVACQWTVQQDWNRPYQRWLAAGREATAYGQWARCFGPGANDLYAQLKEETSDELIVVSNFHDYITLETGIPAIPVPANREVLDEWVKRIVQARGLESWRVLFVLDPDNRWRDYFMQPFENVVAEFDLNDRFGIPELSGAACFQYTANPTLTRR